MTNQLLKEMNKCISLITTFNDCLHANKREKQKKKARQGHD